MWKRLKIQQSNFKETEHIVYACFVCVREFGQTMMVGPNYEMASGLEKEPNNSFVFSADAIREDVRNNVGENWLLVSGPDATFVF